MDRLESKITTPMSFQALRMISIVVSDISCCAASHPVFMTERVELASLLTHCCSFVLWEHYLVVCPVGHVMVHRGQSSLCEYDGASCH